MLFTPIVLIFELFLKGLVAVLPTSTGFTSNFTDALTTFFGYAYSFNDIFPIDTLLTVMVALVAFEAAVLGYKFVRWILSIVRGTNLKGSH